MRDDEGWLAFDGLPATLLRATLTDSTAYEAHSLTHLLPQKLICTHTHTDPELVSHEVFGDSVLRHTVVVSEGTLLQCLEAHCCSA